MSIFTQGSERDKPSVKSVFVKVDSKGRISIPAFLRKNFDLKKGDSVTLFFDLKKNFLLIGAKTEVVL